MITYDELGERIRILNENLSEEYLEESIALEREACAKVAERLAAKFGKDGSMQEVVACAAVAAEIRARGKS